MTSTFGLAPNGPDHGDRSRDLQIAVQSELFRRIVDRIAKLRPPDLAPC